MPSPQRSQKPSSFADSFDEVTERLHEGGVRAAPGWTRGQSGPRRQRVKVTGDVITMMVLVALPDLPMCGLLPAGLDRDLVAA